MFRRRFLDGLDRRLGYRRLLSAALDERVPGGASFAYVFGSVALILFLVQLATGVVLAAYYSPSASDAWASIAYLEREISSGAVLRSVHHHAAGAMVVVTVLHLVQVVVFGAYKAPREGNWLSGLAMLGLVLAFALTGYLLPWDQKGYWATKVATSIAGTVPVLGDALRRLAQGGNDYGNLTLTRFFAIHVLVLPLGLLGLVAVHVYLFRRHGVTPRPGATSEELEAKSETFWPKQVAFDAVAATAVVALVVYLGATVRAPLTAPADPSSNYVARPEWYFLFLFQLLKYFEGPLQIVGTVVLPGLAFTFLAALPFLDRSPSRRLRHRWPWVGSMAAGLLGMLGLSLMAVRADQKDPKLAEQDLVARREAERAHRLAAAGVPPAGASYMLSIDPQTRGERVFARECLECHVLEGRGPKEPKGPELTAYGSRAWIRQVLRNPEGPRLFGATKLEGMESFASLGEEKLALLVDLVYAQRDPKAVPVGERKGAELLEEHECSDCHDFEEAYGLEGPALFRYQSPEWLLELLSDPGASHLYGEDSEMPKFETRLSKADREAVVSFLQTLEARALQDAWPFVDDPVVTRAGRTGGENH